MAKINLGRVVGKSAYELALDNGFVGTINDWLLSLIGEQGASAYEVAVNDGFEGSVSDWLLSLHGIDGKSAYEVAVSNGFIGTEQQWLDSLKGADGTTDYNELDNRPDLSVYQTKTDESLGTISKNVIGAINEVNEKLPVIHSDLEELNGDPNFQHITSTEKASYEAKTSFILCDTYAQMINLLSTTNNAIFVVENDENKSMNDTVYIYNNNPATLMWIAANKEIL